MLQTVVDYYNRYKRPILIVSGIVSFVYFAGSFTKNQVIKFQKDAASTRKAKENLKKRFEKNLDDTQSTILILLNMVKHNIDVDYPIEELIQELNDLKDNQDKQYIKSQKVIIWENIKIMSFTRTIGSMYILNVLSLLTYIQMNLVGRLMYIDSVVGNHNIQVELDTSTPIKMSLENEKLFLGFSWWFINKGYQRLLATVNQVVQETVKSIPLKQKFNYSELFELFMTIRLKLDLVLFEDTEYLLNSLFPKTYESEWEVLQANGHNLSIDKQNLNDEDYEQACNQIIDKDLRSLINESKDFIESHDFKMVFEKVQDSFTETFLLNLKNSLYPDINPSLSLAKVSSEISKFVELVLSSNDNEYLQTASQCPELIAFAAVMYSSFQFLN